MTDAQQTADDAAPPTAEPSGPAAVPLLAPREGVPEVTADDAGLAAVVAWVLPGRTTASGAVAPEAEQDAELAGAGLVGPEDLPRARAERARQR